jgi:hypothetical protein|tara:strand:+ start:17 stop:604 length:588 start_codon:yes stop_codon:yes gene_type:complete
MTSLEQGKSFNKTLNKYISSVEDTLQLIQEPFEDKNAAESNSYMKQLKLKKYEDPTLSQLNNKFNQDVVRYIKIYNEYNEQLLKNNTASDGIAQELLFINRELTNTAEQIHNQIEKIGKTNKKLESKLKSRKTELYNKLVELKAQQQKLNHKITTGNTLDASFEDNQRLSDSTNLKYMLLILGSVILALTAVKLN